jgi:hypothetical protein
MPPEHETRNRVFYDHEDEEPRRRRRPVADWGVDEGGFDRMPSRRFSRRGEESRHETRAEQPVSQTIVIEREPEPEWAPEPEDTSHTTREERPPAQVTSGGRRTIVIGGHPDRMPLPRNRPPRTAVDRIGPRPDRIVAYAVALGFLLILIAILTSH